MAQMFLQRLSSPLVACWMESHSVSVEQASQSWRRTSHRFNTDATPVLCFSMSRCSSCNHTPADPHSGILPYYPSPSPKPWRCRIPKDGVKVRKRNGGGPNSSLESVCSAWKGKQSLGHPPGSDEVQQVLPALANFAEFVLDLGRLAVLAGPGQAGAHNLQLLLVLLSYTDLLLVVLVERHAGKLRRHGEDGVGKRG
ncbi:hypothetical protein EYF80_021287 [Liparis tanakae]|uniref:Uncharacterized protein n=1 Tax=Liparis tanakae TaxID=230148 RepID=A0A4Z2HUD4_9TELE|nr:hypothetical protein EYF80_021287 [Liparis tanakae]